MLKLFPLRGITLFPRKLFKNFISRVVEIYLSSPVPLTPNRRTTQIHICLATLTKRYSGDGRNIFFHALDEEGSEASAER